MWADCARSMSAGRHVRAVGAEHARQAEVGQLAHKAARVLCRRLAALDEHVGALQVTTEQRQCAVRQSGHFSPERLRLPLQGVPLKALHFSVELQRVMCLLMHTTFEGYIAKHTPHVAFMQLCGIVCVVSAGRGVTCAQCPGSAGTSCPRRCPSG